jgi:hypothetical protein
MWLDEYHVDGLRYDATIYIHTVNGSSDRDLPEGWSLLQAIDNLIAQKFPGRIAIAEDLQNNKWLTKDIGAGGAGFGMGFELNYSIDRSSTLILNIGVVSNDPAAAQQSTPSGSVVLALQMVLLAIGILLTFKAYVGIKS